MADKLNPSDADRVELVVRTLNDIRTRIKDIQNELPATPEHVRELQHILQTMSNLKFIINDLKSREADGKTEQGPDTQ